MAVVLVYVVLVLCILRAQQFAPAQPLFPLLLEKK
jgi:hypothetical protein